MNKRKKLSFLGFWLVLFLAYLWLPVGQLAQSTLWFLSKTHSLFWLLAPVAALSLLTAYFFTVFLWALLEKRIARGDVIAFYVLYFAFALSTLLLRGSGSYGWNFNPFNIFTTGQFISLVTVLNLMLFIPVGFLLKLNVRNFALMAVIIAIIEVTQALTHQGFCDIDDWLLNLISYLIGTQLARLTAFIKIN
ncbi:MAG: VanZ family protein [Streptococcaceae bacterium]|jgi:glycopeptide antibiotics resistance protein|nr:VanZ family protein [Streptococcaceae bacterium]